MLKIADIVDESVVDGEGIRVTVFFQGCRHSCAGCHNPDLLPFAGGNPYSAEDLGGLLLKKLTKLHRGLTFSGGDPLFQADGLTRLINYLRRENSAVNIWLYTGFFYEQVRDWPAVRGADVLVDGPFLVEQKDLYLPFRGSVNQRLIDVRSSLAAGKTVEYILKG
jgi:anaerobic ribonucleoside-triphosphate reductase activating protein